MGSLLLRAPDSFILYRSILCVMIGDILLSYYTTTTLAGYHVGPEKSDHPYEYINIIYQIDIS